MIEKIKKAYNSKPGFIISAISWLVLAGVLPIIFINTKYPLFKKVEGELKFCGWALIALLIAFACAYALCAYIIKAFSVKYRFWVKLLKGFQKVILPLAIVYLAMDVASKNIANIKYVLALTIISEIMAIIINPFPKWSYQHNVADTRSVYGLGGKN